MNLWPIVEILVMSENDGITVRQTFKHIIQLRPQARYAMRFMNFEEKGTVMCSISKPSCCNNGTCPYVIGGYINTVIISGHFRSKIKMPNLYAVVLPHE